MQTISTTEPEQDAPAPINMAEQRRATRERQLSIAMPMAALAIAVGGWEAWVRINDIPHYLIPAPSRIARTLVVDGPSLMKSAWFTIKLTLFSLGLAIVGGVLL